MSRDVDFRADHDDGNGEHADDADLHEGGEVVARGQQQPYGQDRGDEAIDDQAPGDGDLVQVEHGGAPFGARDGAAANDGGHQQYEADNGNFHDLAGTQVAQVDTHKEGNRNGHADGEDTPRAFAQRVDYNEGQDRDDDDHDEQRGNQGRGAADNAEFLAGHLPQGTAAAAHGEEHHQVVLHGAGEDDAEDDPHGARQVAHLGRDDRADERAGAGDGGEVVAEEDVAVGADVVLAVSFVLGGGGAAVVGPQQVLLNELGVEAVSDQVGTDGGEHKPDGVHGLAADDGEHKPGHAAQQRNGGPQCDLARSPAAFFAVPDGIVNGCGRKGRIRRDAVVELCGTWPAGGCHTHVSSLRNPAKRADCAAPTLRDLINMLQVT